MENKIGGKGMIIVALIAALIVIFFAVEVLKNHKNRYRIGLFAGIMVLLFAIGGLVNQNQSPTKFSQVAVAKTIKKVTAKDKYQTAKKENVALVAKKKKLLKQERKLKKQKSSIVKQEAAAQANQAAAQTQDTQPTQSQSQSQSRGDMNTGDSKQIVGNVNSHIYHVPGQSGYNMNSKNAVYFNTEQDAINAGYRRAKR